MWQCSHATALGSAPPTNLGAGTPGPANHKTIRCSTSVCLSFGPIGQNFTVYVTQACARRPGAAASVSRRRRERRILLAGGGRRASRSHTLAGSQAFERMHMHFCHRVETKAYDSSNDTRHLTQWALPTLSASSRHISDSLLSSRACRSRSDNWLIPDPGSSQNSQADGLQRRPLQRRSLLPSVRLSIQHSNCQLSRQIEKETQHELNA
jgi:hypothetical protein